MRSTSINGHHRETEFVETETVNKGIEAGKRAVRTGAISAVIVVCIFAVEWGIYRAVYPPPMPLAIDLIVVTLPALALFASSLSVLFGLLTIGFGYLTLRLPTKRSCGGGKR